MLEQLIQKQVEEDSKAKAAMDKVRMAASYASHQVQEAKLRILLSWLEDAKGDEDKMKAFVTVLKYEFMNAYASGVHDARQGIF